MKSEEFELYVYRNGFEKKTLIDILDILSVKTMEYMIKDLKKLEENNGDDDDTVYVYTDGGAKNNGKQNSKAVYGVYVENMDNLSDVWVVSDLVGTNQVAELMGIREGLRVINKLNSSKRVVLCTDSMYGIKCVTDWSKRWKENNWRTAKNEEVKNRALIEEILELYDNERVEFKHIKSHMKEPEDKKSLHYRMWYGNKKVDEMVSVCLEKDN